MDVLLIIFLVIAAIYIVLNAGDFVWHIVEGVKKLQKGRRSIPKNVLDVMPPRLMAIALAAWHEESILSAAIENIFASVQYPSSMYHIFIGLHTNDAETFRVAAALVKKYPNLHIVPNPKAGPTSKADAVNNVLKYIKSYERQNARKFRAVIIHDAKDVMHPYELRVTNYLIDDSAVLQFPVLPVQEMPKVKNIVRNLTSGTYADFFAQRHHRFTASSNLKSGIIASSGAGFVISSEVIDSFEDCAVFPEESVFDNVVYMAKLKKEGFDVHYVTEHTERLLDSGKLGSESVAVRAIFPTTFSGAVKQRSRWRRAMSKNAPKTRDLFMSGIGCYGRHCLFDAYRNGLNNILALPSVAIFVWFIVSLFAALPTEFEVFSSGWWVLAAFAFLIIEREVMRFVAVNETYGARSAIVSALLPPFVPIRYIYGKFIDLCAAIIPPKDETPVAAPREEVQAPAVVHEQLTDGVHEYLDQTVLNRYYRNLGDVLLEKDFVSADTLRWALDVSKGQDRLVGEVLLHGKKISEEHLMRALASVKHTLFLPELRGFVCREYGTDWDKETLESCIAFPVLKTDEGYVMAISDESPQSAPFMLEIKSGRKIQVVYATRTLIRDAINALYSPTFKGVWSESPVYRMFRDGSITWEQAILTRIYQSLSLQSTDEVLGFMGLRVSEKKD